MEHPNLMPGAAVRDGDDEGTVTSRTTSRNDAGPVREIEVDYPAGRRTYTNSEIGRLESR